MADTLVEKVTGQTRADQVPVEVQLVITDKALLGGDHTPARIDGHGPIPAVVARRLIAGLHQDTACWIRRLYADPTTGQLTTIDSARRTFTGTLRRAIVIRDDLCRTPWCGAPIRHIDHVVPARNGGPTSEANGQGLCQACNHAKQAPGWHSQSGPGGAGESVHVTTPTGHTYTSRPPPLPGTPEVDTPPAPDPGRRHDTFGRLQYTAAS
jgi:HNH endonuclease